MNISILTFNSQQVNLTITATVTIVTGFIERSSDPQKLDTYKQNK